MSFSSSELLVPTTSVSPALCPSVVWSDASAAATAGGRITDQTCRWRCYHRAVACPRGAHGTPGTAACHGDLALAVEQSETAMRAFRRH